MRIALIADFVEEAWPSMDLVADMLAVHLLDGSDIKPALEVQLIRPAMKMRASRWLQGGGSGRLYRAGRNFDRRRSAGEKVLPRHAP